VGYVVGEKEGMKRGGGGGGGGGERYGIFYAVSQ